MPLKVSIRHEGIVNMVIIHFVFNIMTSDFDTYLYMLVMICSSHYLSLDISCFLAKKES